METVTSNNREIYISESKTNINNYIEKREFRQAFGLFIMVIERLDEAERTKFIDYYSKNLSEFGFFSHTFPDVKIVLKGDTYNVNI